MDLDVDGSLPRGLSGRYLFTGVADWAGATVHVVRGITLGNGRATALHDHPIEADRIGVPDVGLVEFTGRLFSLVDGSRAVELAADLAPVRPVDLAGGGRGVGAHPRLDRASGELFLISSPGTTTPFVHVISPGSLTRRTLPVTTAPTAVRDLTISDRHVLLAADGAVGVTTRDGAGDWSWHRVGATPAYRVVAAHDTDHAVVLHVTSPALERWTLRRDHDEIDRTEIDPRPQTAGFVDEARTGQSYRYLYAVDRDAGRVLEHDLLTGIRTHHDLAARGVPAGFLFVADPARRSHENGGWLLGLVRSDSGRTRLVVLDAADVAGPAVAVVHLPVEHHSIHGALHALWSPTHP
ncbi:MAG: carotenoid oxygenase family protein [Acidimicrobiales bacterium]